MNRVMIAIACVGLLISRLLVAESCTKSTADKGSWYHFSEVICFLSKDDPEFGWLSNHYTEGGKLKLQTDEGDWASPEHYFQYKKLALVMEPDKAKSMIQKAASTQEAKEIANKEFNEALEKLKKESGEKSGAVISQWRKINIPTMAFALEKKFTQNNELKEKLLRTGKRVIVFNDKKDGIWGIGSDEKGKNQLGRILMWVREKIQNPAQQDYDAEKTFDLNSIK